MLFLPKYNFAFYLEAFICIWYWGITCNEELVIRAIIYLWKDWMLNKTKIICSVTNKELFVVCFFCDVKISPVIGYNTIKIPDILCFKCSRFYKHNCKAVKKFNKIKLLFWFLYYCTFSNRNWIELAVQCRQGCWNC